LETVKAFFIEDIDYKKCWDLQIELNQKRIDKKINDVLLLVTHPPVITIGRTGKKDNILASKELLKCKSVSIYEIGRGGDVTFHGPGQLMIYPIINLRNFFKDMHKYIWSLEETVIGVLNKYNINSERKNGYPGVWIGNEKIAAIGVRVKHWVSMHGIAFNISTDIGFFNLIDPCGISRLGFGVTSMERVLNKKVSFKKIVSLYVKSFEDVFGCNAELTYSSLENRPKILKKLSQAKAYF